MSSSFSLPDGTIVYVEEAPRGLRLQPAFGGARIELNVRIYANRAVPDSTNRLSATLQFGPSPNHSDLQGLASMTGTNLLSINPTPTLFTFVGHASIQALREVEEVRQGGSLWLVLADLRAMSVFGDPARLVENTGFNDLRMELLSEEWAREWEKVTAASYVEILVPVTDDTELATAAGRLRTAIGYIRGGVFNAVPAELRQALDPVRTAYDTTNVVQAARDKKARDRSVLERWALTVEDTYSLLSAFIHDDEEAIEGASLDRALAVNLLGDVAGKVHRLAADRHAGRA